MELSNWKDDSDDEFVNSQPPPKKKKNIHSYIDGEAGYTIEDFSVFPEKCIDEDHSGVSTPLDFFSIFFSDKVFEFIRDQSIQYSGLVFTMEELHAVFGVLIGSGVVSQKRRRDYWSNNQLKKNVAISKSIGQKRFESIFSALHFLPMDANISNDKFQKIRLLYSMLNRSFIKNTPRCSSFSIDEAMVPYYGRHGCKQHIKGKPLRFGFKQWVLATPMGYCCQIQPYPGLAERSTEDYDYGASGNIVYFFCKLFREHLANNTAFSVTVDNFFSSLKLFQDLYLKLNVLATGTFRVNRIPQNPFPYATLKKSVRGTFQTK